MTGVFADRSSPEPIQPEPIEPEPIEPEPIDPEPPALGRRVIMRQRWTDLAYFHWPYDPAVVQRTLPDGVFVDTFDGNAWVGLIPFVMRDVRLGPLPPIPHLSTFVEINVRTYVVDRDGRRAVWFYSLDVPRLAIVGVARAAFGLPYCWSAGASHTREGDRHRYEIRSRTWPRQPEPARLRIGYTAGPAIEPADETAFDRFVSARWALLTRVRGAVRYGRVHHERWPLRSVVDVDVEVDESAIAAAGLPAPVGEPHARCADAVSVRLGWLERSRR